MPLGKRESRRPKARRGESESDNEDAHSETSHATVDSMGSMHSLEPPPSITRGGSSRSVRSFVDEQHAEETAEESLHKAFEDLAEKRSSLRESALHQIIRSLSTKFMPEAVEKSAGPWIESLKRCLRREGSEPLLANRALALLWISGGSQPEHFDDLVKLLGEGLLDGEAEVKASCVRTLAMIVFIENAGDSVMQELLSSWEDVLEAADQHDPEVVRNTLEAYGLIYAMPSARPGHDDYNRVLDMHLELLNADDLDVRIAAGENIAIIVEDRAHHAEEDEPENTKPFYESRHQLIQQLTFLSHDSTRHRAKKERAVQKSAFRDILQTVESNVAPMEKIKIKHETVECDSWSKIRQLNAFRDIVGEGLSVHFRENPLLQHVFHLSFDGPAPGKITSTERRLYQTIVGKARTKALKQMRGTRAAVKSSGEG